MLTAQHPAVQLLLEGADFDNLHEGTDYVRNILQQEFWKLGLINAMKKIKSKCVKDRHRSADRIHPPMTDLTRERFDELVFPLTHTRVECSSKSNFYDVQ